MNVHLPAARRGWPARLVNLAVVIVVLALAAATFVLSYTGVHAIALQAGVSARLARIYPGVFDAVLVIACAAAVTLRDARWWARCYAWVTIILVVAVVGAADAVHAMNVALPRRQTEGVVAAAPWVLVLLGFSLMLTMLRQSRAHHARTGPARELARTPSAPALPVAVMPDAQAAPAESGDTALAGPQAGQDHPPALAFPPFADQETPPTVPAAELGGPDGQPAAWQAIATPDAAAQEAAAQDESAAAQFRYAPAPELAPWAAGHDGADTGTDADVLTGTPRQASSIPSWHELVADSGDPGTLRRHDYWDMDDQNGANDRHRQPAPGDEDAPLRASPFTTVPHLNRVRATPIPPEDDEE